MNRKVSKSNLAQRTVLRPLLDVINKVPPERFGQGSGKRLRKSVLLAIAASCDPDGTNSYPSIETLAKRTLSSRRQVGRVLDWLENAGILTIQSKAGRAGKLRGRTNLYTINFEILRPPDEDISHRHRDISKRDEDIVRSDEDIVRSDEDTRCPITALKTDQLNRHLDQEKSKSLGSLVHAQPQVSSPILREVETQIATLTNNQVFFLTSHKPLLASLIDQYGKGEVLQAFNAFWQTVGDDSVAWAGKNFIEQAEVRIEAVRLKRRNEDATKKLVEAAVTAARKAAEAELAEAEEEFEEEL